MLSTSNKNQHAISITDVAIDAILQLKKRCSDQFLLRIGIKQGGCSGMSYFMKVEQTNKIIATDEIIDYQDFQIVCDSKSLLFLYGLSLDYNPALIGGGFCFINPNATQTCGCGKSFAA